MASLLVAVAAAPVPVTVWSMSGCPCSAQFAYDFNATILHLMGLNHEKLTYRYSGRDFRLTDVHGNVVHEIIA